MERAHGEGGRCLLADRYRILTFLGGGGFGSVFLAEDTELNEKVALKLLRPELTKNERILERFRREIRIARKLSHRNIVRLHELHREEDALFFTMEHLEGKDLKTIIQEQPSISSEERLRIAIDVCQGLSYAHSRHVIHRDVKSSNIFLTSDGVVKILDFGLSTSRESEGITDSGSMLGTPDYMSPEQVRGEPSTLQSDIYSLGVVLYELWTGELPFAGDTAMAAAVKRLLEEPPDPARRGRGMPEGIARVTVRAMARDRRKRYKSAQEMAEELKLSAGSNRLGHAQRASPAPAAPSRTLSRPPASTEKENARSTVDLKRRRACRAAPPAEPGPTGSTISAAGREPDDVSLLALVLERGSDAQEILVDPEGVSMRTPAGLERVFDLDDQAAKILAELKAATEGTSPAYKGPQEGRLEASALCPGSQASFRVFILTGKGRERAVLRRMAESNLSLEPESIGLPEAILSRCRKALRAPPGLLVVCGPARSGKTRTALCLASMAADMNLSVMCAVDRIENQAAQVIQVAANPDEGMGFKKVLKSFEFKGAEVVVVDAGSKPPWALIVEQSEKRAVVCATATSSSPSGAFAGIVEQGVDPERLSRIFRLAVFQILVPTLCPSCKKPAFIEDEARRRLESLAGSPGPEIFESNGCLKCLNTGRGQAQPLFDLVPSDPSVRGWLRSGCPQQSMPPSVRSDLKGRIGRKLAGLVASGAVAAQELARFSQGETMK